MQYTDHQQFLDTIFAKNKALYGGYVMELAEGEEPAEGTEGEQAEKDAAEKKPAEGETPETPEAEKPAEGEGGEELPEWAREKLTKANTEAADYRTKLRAAETTIEGFKEHVSPEDHQAGIDQAVRELLIENVALKHQLPENLRKRLVGATREELEADAKELASEFSGVEREVVLEGGLTPRGRDADSNSNPRELASKHGSRR